jgi:hypothetical protein
VGCRGFATTAAILGEKTPVFHGPVECDSRHFGHWAENGGRTDSWAKDLRQRDHLNGPSPITAFCPLRRIILLFSALKAENILCGAKNMS